MRLPVRVSGIPRDAVTQKFRSYFCIVFQVERELIKSGVVQLLPCRDKAGRRVLARLGNYGTAQHSMRNKIRVALYFGQVLSEDEETQKQGCVLLHWPLHSEFSTPNIGPLHQVLRTIPIRFSAMHFCFGEDQGLVALGVRTILLAVPEFRTRCRIHVGKSFILISFPLDIWICPHLCILYR
jgi:hypothetical protein